MMKWRKWNNIFHRDLGYLCFGLTLIYAISGVAVNHSDVWNPNYDIEYVESNIQPVTEKTDDTGQLVDTILQQLNIQKPPKNTFRPDPETIDIFFDKHTVTANFVTGHVLQETISNRAGLRHANFLHVNEPKKLWTWFADLYAISLAILAITGLFVLKGKNGLTGRGWWLTAIGIAIPLVFLAFYF